MNYQQPPIEGAQDTVMNDLPHESDPSLVGNDYVLSRTG